MFTFWNFCLDLDHEIFQEKQIFTLRRFFHLKHGKNVDLYIMTFQLERTVCSSVQYTVQYISGFGLFMQNHYQLVYHINSIMMNKKNLILYTQLMNRSLFDDNFPTLYVV